MEEFGYQKIERYNEDTLEKLAYHYKEIISLLGEDVNREGLLATPMRVAKAMQFFTHGYDLKPEEILRSAMFNLWNFLTLLLVFSRPSLSLSVPVSAFGV